jgi:toxin ParE1/3/4
VRGCLLGMSRKLVQDNAAAADLIGIWVYSFETWGEAQADRYLDALEQGSGKIAEDPTRGESRHQLRDGYWSKSIEHHVVFYTFNQAEVRIRRVLHEAMDVGRHL